MPRLWGGCRVSFQAAKLLVVVNAAEGRVGEEIAGRLRWGKMRGAWLQGLVAVSPILDTLRMAWG